MAKATHIITNVTAGELSPLLAGRVDLARYHNAGEELTNMLIRTQGAITRRPGLQFIAEVKDHAKKVRLIPFEFSTTQAYILEFGDYYVRFYKDKGLVVSAGVAYEIETPWPAAALAELCVIQSADTLYITHPDYPPHKLSRMEHTAWVLNLLDLHGPYLGQNTTGLTISPSGTTGEVTLTANTAIGPNKIQNGDFETAAYWTFGGGWSHDAVNKMAKRVHYDGWGDLIQNANVEVGKTYYVSYEIVGLTKGKVRILLGGVYGPYRDANGFYVETITATSTQDLYFSNNEFEGFIDNVSVNEVGGNGDLVANGDFATSPDTAWTWGAGWAHDTVAFEADHTPGATVALEQDIGVQSGHYYRLTYTIKNRTAGSITPEIGTTNGATRVSDGTFTEVIVAAALGNLKLNPSTDFDGSLDDIEVVETPLTADIFQPGHVGALWGLQHGATWGYAVIIEYVSGTEVVASVKQPFGATTPTFAWREGAFSGFRGYPRACTFHEERLWFGGTSHQPQTLWASKSGDFENLLPEDTITAAGPLAYTLAADQMDTIIWLASARLLMVGTTGGEWKVSASQLNAAITPMDVSVRRNTTYGSAQLRAQPVGDVVLFVQKQGRKVRELAYSFDRDNYVAPDLAIISEHITKSGIVDMAYQREPDQTLWAVRADGVLLPMVYERSHEVVGWSKIITDGVVEAVATIPGVNQTEIWVAVQRIVNGLVRRYLEVFTDVDWGEDLSNCFLVDSGLTYNGAPATVITGLDHLEGKEVDIMADGFLLPRQTVSGGGITLEEAASVVHVGLPYAARFKSVRLEAGATDGTAQGKLKRVDRVTLRLYQSVGGKVGPDENNLEIIDTRSYDDPMDQPPPLFTGDKELDFRGDYESTGQIMVVQEDPLPLTVCALIPRVTVFEQ